jgi:type I restriction enzyme R subunit
VKLMGDDVLLAIARELTQTLRRNVSLDWTQRESARAKLRTTVRRLLRKHGYPPDKQEQATRTVMEQAERLCETWAEDGLLGSEPSRSSYADEPAAPLPMAAESEPRLSSDSGAPPPPRRR